jgi:hypothetical protein
MTASLVVHANLNAPRELSLKAIQNTLSMQQNALNVAPALQFAQQNHPNLHKLSYQETISRPKIGRLFNLELKIILGVDIIRSDR